MAEKTPRTPDQPTAEAAKPEVAHEPLTGAPIAVQPSLEMPKRPAPMKQLDEMRFVGREFKQNEWFVTAEKGTTIEHLLMPEYWANNAGKLRPRDKIAVMTEDSRLYLELIVFTVGSNWAQVRVLGQPITVSEAVSRSSVADDFEVKYLGLHLEWGIIRKSDGRVVKGDSTLKTEDAARAWLREYLQSIGRRSAA